MHAMVLEAPGQPLQARQVPVPEPGPQQVLIEQPARRAEDQQKSAEHQAPPRRKVAEGEVYLVTNRGERKATGSYYTPKYIVDYIVEHTVGKLLEGKTPKQAEKLRVLDPACGSGSFLIGAYQYLLDWHAKWYTDNDPERHSKGKAPAVFHGKGGWRLTWQARRRPTRCGGGFTGSFSSCGWTARWRRVWWSNFWGSAASHGFWPSTARTGISARPRSTS